MSSDLGLVVGLLDLILGFKGCLLGGFGLGMSGLEFSFMLVFVVVAFAKELLSLTKLQLKHDGTALGVF